MINKKIAFKISNIFIVLAAVVYVFYYYLERKDSLHFLLFFSIASFIYSIRVLLHAILYKVLYRRYTNFFYTTLDWAKFFSISQLYGAFIPGSAFVMRAYVIREKYNVSFKKSIFVYGAFYLTGIAMFLITVAVSLGVYSNNFLYKYIFQTSSSLFFSIFIAFILSAISFFLIRRYRNELTQYVSLFTKEILVIGLFIQALSFVFTYFSFYILFNAVSLQSNLSDTFNTFIVLQSLVYLPQFIPGNIGIQEVFLAVTGGSYTMSLDALILYSSSVRLLVLIGSLMVYFFSVFCKKITDFF